MTAHQWSDIEPVPADWFSSSARYEGEGQATFGDPASVVSGHVVVSCDEYGKATARMTDPVIVSSEREFRSGVSELLLSTPPCLALTVTSADGSFDAGSKVFYDYEERNLFHAPEDTSTVTVDFHWLRAQFLGATATEARYWVLPLLNFLFSPNQRAEVLDRHPLRIYPTPIVPEDADPDRAFFRREHAHQKNRLVIFEYNRGPGFIERLADYDDRQTRLASRSERRLVTAVMVGVVGGASETWEALGTWFPFDLLGVLGVASGAEVGAPWVELRDGEGALVRRWHVALGTPDYHRGHGAIHEAVHGGTGRLITCACTSKEFGSTHLRVAVRHLVDGLAYEQPIEERLGHFCRGIDGLCRAYGLTGRNLLYEVKGEYRGRVRKAIAGAASAIEAIAADATGAGDLADSETLRQIAGRTRFEPPTSTTTSATLPSDSWSGLG